MHVPRNSNISPNVGSCLMVLPYNHHILSKNIWITSLRKVKLYVYVNTMADSNPHVLTSANVFKKGCACAFNLMPHCDCKPIGKRCKLTHGRLELTRPLCSRSGGCLRLRLALTASWKWTISLTVNRAVTNRAVESSIIDRNVRHEVLHIRQSPELAVREYFLGNPWRRCPNSNQTSHSRGETRLGTAGRGGPARRTAARKVVAQPDEARRSRARRGETGRNRHETAVCVFDIQNDEHNRPGRLFAGTNELNSMRIGPFELQSQTFSVQCGATSGRNTIGTRRTKPGGFVQLTRCLSARRQLLFCSGYQKDTRRLFTSIRVFIRKNICKY